MHRTAPDHTPVGVNGAGHALAAVLAASQPADASWDQMMPFRWLPNRVDEYSISLRPRLVQRRIGAAGILRHCFGTVAFRLYLVIIVQSLTN